MAAIPSHPNSITPAWLTERLRAAGLLDEPEEVIEVVTQEREPDLPSELDNLPAEPGIQASIETHPDVLDDTEKNGWSRDAQLLIARYRNSKIPAGARIDGILFDGWRIERIEKAIDEGPSSEQADRAIGDLRLLDRAGALSRSVPVAS